MARKFPFSDDQIHVRLNLLYILHFLGMLRESKCQLILYASIVLLVKMLVVIFIVSGLLADDNTIYRLLFFQNNWPIKLRWIEQSLQGVNYASQNPAMFALDKALVNHNQDSSTVFDDSWWYINLFTVHNIQNILRDRCMLYGSTFGWKKCIRLGKYQILLALLEKYKATSALPLMIEFVHKKPTKACTKCQSLEKYLIWLERLILLVEYLILKLIFGFFKK